MDLFKIAFKNVKNSAKLYRLYVFSLVFSVVIFYQFINLYDNPIVTMMNLTAEIEILTAFCLFVMMVFVVFFLLFSNGFYLKERKKEIGLYVLMGTTPKKIGLIVAIENIVVYCLSTLVGILVGLLFSKLFVMMTVHFLEFGIDVPFHFSKNAVIITFIMFIGLGILTSLISYLKIHNKQILQLLKGKQIEEGVPKGSVVIGVISLGILFIGYYASAKMNSVNLLQNGLTAIICVIVGTFLFYRSVMTMVFKALIRWKGFVYKKNRLVTVSSMMYRIGTNYKIYAAVSIFLTCTLTAFSTSASFKFGLDDMNKVEFPFTISYKTQEETGLYDEMMTYIIDNGGAVTYSTNQMPFYTISQVAYEMLDNVSTTEVVRYADYENNIKPMAFKTESEVLYSRDLLDHECLYIYPGSAVVNIGDVNYLDIGDDFRIHARRSFKAPVMGHGSDTIIVNDHNFEALKSYMVTKDDGTPAYYYFTGIDIQEDALFIGQHEEAFLEMASTYGVTLEIKPNSEINSNDALFVVIQLFYVLGLFLALTFIISTGSIIYFRIVSSAAEDRETYQLLYKMGLDRSVISQMIYKQNLLFFIVPMAIAFVHSVFASMSLERFMGISLMEPLLQSSLFIGGIFLVYYLITVQSYKKIVLDT